LYQSTVETFFGGSYANAPTSEDSKLYGRQSYSDQAKAVALGVGLGKLAGQVLGSIWRRVRGAASTSDELAGGAGTAKGVGPEAVEGPAPTTSPVLRPPSPNRVNPNAPAPRVPPDSLFGRSFQDFGRDVIKWGTGPRGAQARMQTITRQELTQAGVTQPQAQAARDFYMGVLARNPGNAAAAARVQLMNHILQLLGGS
jgi:hypothetical protein